MSTANWLLASMIGLRTTWTACMPAAGLDETCRGLVARLGQDGWLRYAVPRAFGGALRSSRLALAVPDPRNAGAPCGTGRFRLCHAGAGQRRDFPARQRRAEAALSAARRERRVDRRLRAVRARSGFGRRGDDHQRAGWRANTMCSTGSRPGSRTAASPTSTRVFARTGEGAGREGADRVRGRRGYARTRDRRAHRRHRAASACDACAFDGCRVPAAKPPGRRRRGLQSGDGDAGHLPRVGRRRGCWVSRGALWTRRSARARGRKMFGQALADFQLTQAAIADMATAIDSAALLTYRAAWLRDVKGARTTREAAMAKLVATEGGAAGDRPRGADLRRAGRAERPIVEQLYREIRAAAHLRRRERSAEADHRARNTEGCQLHSSRDP